MRPVDKALQFIEGHLGAPLSLADIAVEAQVSPFHLLRAFHAATGLPVMRYVRLRRLSEAARRLSAGSGDILAVALDSGYASHEAFSRAFRAAFDTTPEAVRARGAQSDLPLVDALVPLALDARALRPPCVSRAPTLLVCGVRERVGVDTPANVIQAQWRRLSSIAQDLEGRVGKATYGVCSNPDGEGNMDYIAGIAVSRSQALPAGVTTIRLSPAQYLVFTHEGQLSSARHTWNAIWNGWLPASPYQPMEAPLLERYGSVQESRLTSVEFLVPIQE